MYLDELNTNMEFDLPEVVVSKGRMIEFAKLYDPFPLHHDEEFAGKTRFGRLVAPGVMSFMSVWARFIDLGVLGDELIASLRKAYENGETAEEAADVLPDPVLPAEPVDEPTDAEEEVSIVIK